MAWFVWLNVRGSACDKVQASFIQNGDEDVESRTKLIDGLKMSLRTEPMSFVLRFTDLDGLDCLLDFLKGMSYAEASSTVHTSVLGCLKALMNSTVSGKFSFLAHGSANFEHSGQRQIYTLCPVADPREGGGRAVTPSFWALCISKHYMICRTVNW